VNEHSFIKAIHRKLPKDIYRWKVSDRFTGGVPDCYYEGSKGALWVEYKYLKSLPKKTSTLINPGVSKLQLAWLERAERNGVNTMLVAGYPCGSISRVVILPPEKSLTSDFYKKNALSIDEFLNVIQNAIT
jgi:hypothetical protein